MENQGILFWNVDTQIDFMEPDGKLYAPGAESIKPVLEKLTRLAKEKNIQVVNTADHHYEGSRELSESPDFINTFPEHCMADSFGADYISETQPELPCADLRWNKAYLPEEIDEIAKSRNIIIRKDAFDVFEGNPYTDDLLTKLAPNKVYVYGVTTNVCVHFAAIGLAQRNIEVLVIEDAIKELPNIPLPYGEWDKLDIKRIKSNELGIL